MQMLLWILHGIICLVLFMNGFQNAAKHYSWFICADFLLTLGFVALKAIIDEKNSWKGRIRR